MFKNLIIYRLTGAAPAGAAIAESLQDHAFLTCGATQEKSVGFVSPRGEDGGALAETIDGQTIIRLAIEAKVVPGDAIQRTLKERLSQIEATTGRKPGKKESRELKDEIRLDMLPMTIPKLTHVLAWIDPVQGILAIDAASQGRADEVLTAIARALGIGATPIMTTISPTAAMSDWLLSQEPPAGFALDRECELKAGDDSKAVVRYSHHALDIEEIQGHIQHGKLPTRLAMTWEGRVSFVLDGAMRLKKLAFLEGVLDGAPESDKADRFDADVAIFTGEMRKLIPALLTDALGGEVEMGGEE